MRRWSLGRHGPFLFRTYLFLVAGLLVTAFVLDRGFGYLQSGTSREDMRWLSSSFDLIERELADVAENQRDVVADALSDDIGLAIQLLRYDEVTITRDSDSDIVTLVDAAGDPSYLRYAPRLDALIRIGPVAAAGDGALLGMLPALFYLAIFVVVGLWLRPLLRDLNLITDAAQRFAADYREPLSIEGSTTQLKGLAKNLDDMSSRLSGLIRSQKELITALSHEMRTPLARIRFALAVMENNRQKNIKKELAELNDDVQEIDQLIATMLNYARLDHPDLDMHWQEVPLDAWLTHIADKVRQPEKKLTISIHSDIDTAWMDSRLMTLALSNLLVNACRYAVATVRCSIFRDGDGYQVDIEDDGKGIPEAERESVFKAFTRIDDSRNRATGGFGLGLAIVWRVAGLHGGSAIAGASHDLGGAQFTLRWQAPDRRTQNSLDTADAGMA